MTITNIISAIGNNSSIYPLLLRDCGIEVPSKIYITRKENLKESKLKANDATREKFIDEYVTSAVWLGGIPLVEKVADKLILKKGYNPKVNIKLTKEDKFQGLKFNINKFKNSAPEEVKDLEKILKNTKKYENLTAEKLTAAITIPTLLMGFILPKLNFALTKKIKANRNLNKEKNYSYFQQVTMTSFENKRKNCNISFGSNFLSGIANMKTIDKMAVTDGGLTVGRVATSRNKEEGAVNAFRMLGSMFLNFVAPKYIASFLDNSANKLFNINVNIDPKFTENEELISAIKRNNIDLPKSNNAQDLFEFIDQKSGSIFAQLAQENGIISYLKNDVRDPRKYVDINKLADFKTNIENFIKSAQMAKNTDKFIKKAKVVKSINILLNIIISSTLLAIVLPKTQYAFNKFVSGSYSDPGLKDN